MLERYIRELEQIPISDRFQERVEQMTRTFDSLVDYLRKPDTFPNPEINQLATLMWRLIGNKHIPVVLDPTRRMPSISFAVLGNQTERQPFLFLPRNFLELTKEAPEVQIGAFAYMASQCRDFFCNKITGQNSEQINKRAQAYEAEASHTMQKMAQEEGITLRLIPFQQEILEKFPNGIQDLEPELIYETPNYSIFKWGDPRLN
jgi:hypothetical protein